MKRLKFLALIAAAGNSQRMGFHKALFPLFGRWAVCYSAAKIARMQPQQFFVTLPSALMLHDSLCSELRELRATLLANRYPHLGYAGSIKTVLKNLQENSDGILICPVDSPIFCERLLAVMLTMAESFADKPSIIVPNFYGRAGHPVYFSKDFFTELMAPNKNGMRSVIAAHRAYVHALFWPDARIVLNVNSRLDWAPRLRSQIPPQV